MNTKNPSEVQQSIKRLVVYIEDKLKLTVDRIREVKVGINLQGSYQFLDDWYRERHIKRIREEGHGSTKKSVKINVIRTEKLAQEDDIEEQGHKIRSLGNVCNLRKDKMIKVIDEKQEEITKRTPKIEE